MNASLSPTDFVHQLATKLRKLGVVHLDADEKKTPGWRTIPIHGKDLLNFAGCSYLGLESDERLKQAATDAILRYGVQHYCVRAYVSLHPYQELEATLSQVFEKPAIVMPSTALGHWATMPVLMESTDAVILDHQVHATVQMSARILKASGSHVEMIRHSRLDYLESRLKKLRNSHRRVWYLADGVYSMYGDTTPMSGLYELLDRYENFYLYVDDAHGMSWKGKNGSGAALAEAGYFHPKMVLMSSLSKAFGTMGGVAVFPDEEMKWRVRNCGSTLIFTGPIQPPLVAASLASAKIHLSGEIYNFQSRLRGRIQFFHEKAKALDLPFLGSGEAPIFYLGVGSIEAAAQLSKRLIDSGFLTAIAVYPSVPVNNAGLRMLVSNHHTLADISALLETVAELLPPVLAAHELSLEQIHRAFHFPGVAGVEVH